MSSDDKKKPKRLPFKTAVQSFEIDIPTAPISKRELVAKPVQAKKSGKSEGGLGSRLRAAAKNSGVSSSSVKRPRTLTAQGPSQRALDEIDQIKLHVAFIIDATASRKACWSQARVMTGKMFDMVENMDGQALKMKLISLRGGAAQDHGYHDNGSSLKEALAGVNCLGGSTAFTSAMNVLSGGDIPPKIVIAIGDSSEEYLADIQRAARKLNNQNSVIFSFLDTMPTSSQRDAKAGYDALKSMADITGGKFEIFDNFERLAQLLEASLRAAVYGMDHWDRGLIEARTQKLLDGGGPKLLGHS